MNQMITGVWIWMPPRVRSRARTTATRRQYVAWHVQVRPGASSHLLRMGRLFHSYVVTKYADIENDRLRYIRHHQRQLRADTYRSVRAAIEAGAPSSGTGRPVVLPSNFTGGPRYMQQLTQDGFARARKYGKADLFITFTCNPQWPEFHADGVLEPGQAVADRPDIIARVFSAKLKEFLDDLLKKAVLGRMIGYMWTIEWQKRGLPHLHFVGWLHEDHKIRTADDVDTIICAELPDKDVDPELYDTIVKCMMHGAQMPGPQPTPACKRKAMPLCLPCMVCMQDHAAL